LFTEVGEGVADATEIIALLDQVVTQKLTCDELREIVRPKAEEIEEEVRKKRIEAAKKSLPEVIPEVKALETPEEFEKVAKALIEEAQRRKTPSKSLRRNRRVLSKCCLAVRETSYRRLRGLRNLESTRSGWRKRLRR
jgi:hypothetical protein